jgi:integrase
VSPFRPDGRQLYRVKVPNRNRAWRDRATGTRDRPTANAMQRMVDELGPQGKRDWELLEAVFYGRISLPRLYDAYADRQLDQLRAELNDLDLAVHVDAWQEWLPGHVKPATQDRYLVHLRTLIPERAPFFRSQLTKAAVSTWVAQRTIAPRGAKSKALPRPANRATKRKYFAAVQSFVGYLLEIEVLTESPIASLSPPAANDPRVEYLELEDVLRVVHGVPDRFRALIAFLYGTGCDLSTALTLRRRDVLRPDEREVRARGTKRRNRDRVVVVAEWAWPLFEAALANLLPDAPLFPGISRYLASDAHRTTVKALELYRPGITVHAARHHYATRMLRAGTPVGTVAEQLGIDPSVCLKVYGPFVRNSEEVRGWDQKAARKEAR